MKTMIFYNSLILFILLFKVTCCNAQIYILVNKGSFTSVQEAAYGEDKVDFWDDMLVDDRACTESFAAMELAKFLPEATTIKPEEIMFTEHGEMPVRGNVFIIGSRFSNPLTAKYDLSEGRLLDTEQSYYIRSFEENERVVTIIEGADRIGTLYGVYRYLEEMGVKFIGLGAKGTVFPESSSEIPVGIEINENPSYLTRGFYAWGDREVEDEFFLWMARNKLNYWTAESQPVPFLKKLGMKLIEGGHNVQGKVFASDSEYPYNHPIFKADEAKPDDPYKVGDEYLGDVNNDGKLSTFEAHPEWYGLKNNKRIQITSKEPETRVCINFCTSNKDARKEFAKRVTQSFIGGQWSNAGIFNFWTSDGGANKWCDCEECKADGSYTDKMFTVTYDILKEVENARNEGRLKRRVEISNLAYIATLEPPTRPLPDDYDYRNSSITFFPIRRCYVHSFADPACSEINQWQAETFQKWTTGEKRYYQGDMFMGEYYNVSLIKSLPVVFTTIMAVDIPWYYRNGTKHFHYMHTPHRLWGTWTLNQYLMGKLLWDVEADAKVIVDDYFRLYYPTTTSSSRKFYEHLEKASANIKALIHQVGIDPGYNYSLARSLLKDTIFEIDHLQYDIYEPLVNDGPDIVEMMEAMDLAKASLELSLIDCGDVIELERLLEDKSRFEYGYAMYKYLYHLIRTAIFHHREDNNMAGKEFAIVEEYAEELRNMVDVVQVSSLHANAPNGFEAAARFNTAFNFYKNLYSK